MLWRQRLAKPMRVPTMQSLNTANFRPKNESHDKCFAVRDSRCSLIVHKSCKHSVGSYHEKPDREARKKSRPSIYLEKKGKKCASAETKSLGWINYASTREDHAGNRHSHLIDGWRGSIQLSVNKISHAKQRHNPGSATNTFEKTHDRPNDHLQQSKHWVGHWIIFSLSLRQVRQSTILDWCQKWHTGIFVGASPVCPCYILDHGG